MARRRVDPPPDEPAEPPRPTLNSRQRATLAAIFDRPTRADVRWSAVESLIGALGGQIVARGGSPRLLILGSHRVVVHAPHPGPETAKWAVEAVRRFFDQAGVSP